jgi:hypothetical protein
LPHDHATIGEVRAITAVQVALRRQPLGQQHVVPVKLEVIIRHRIDL